MVLLLTACSARRRQHTHNTHSHTNTHTRAHAHKRSAIVLGQYLTSATSCFAGRAWPSGRRQPLVLELGAGTGAVSLCLLAARAVDGAVLTDIPDMLPHLSRNVVHNGRVVNPAQALVAPLRWGDAGDGEPGLLQRCAFAVLHLQLALQLW